jgi:hypothetical protein
VPDEAISSAIDHPKDSMPTNHPRSPSPSPRIEVVQYSELDDKVYLRWQEAGHGLAMAAVPRLEAMDEDPTPLCNRLRGLGLELSPGDDVRLAERVRGECSRRFPTLN